VATVRTENGAVAVKLRRRSVMLRAKLVLRARLSRKTVSPALSQRPARQPPPRLVRLVWRATSALAMAVKSLAEKVTFQMAVQKTALRRSMASSRPQTAPPRRPPQQQVNGQSQAMLLSDRVLQAAFAPVGSRLSALRAKFARQDHR